MSLREPPRLVILALAHDLLIRPELLDAFAVHFGSDPDVRLIVWGQSPDAKALELALTPPIQALGLDAEGGPEIVAFAHEPSAETQRDLAGIVDCMLTHRPQEGALQTLARFDATALADLAAGQGVPVARSASPATEDRGTAEDLTAQLGQPLWEEQIPDKVRGLVGDLSGDSETLFVFFSGLDPSPLPLRYDWLGYAQHLECAGILVRDHSQTWYHDGVAQLGTSIAETARSLQDVIDHVGSQRVVFVGNSAGGYAALLFGTLLEIDEIHAFAPQTYLSSAVRHDLGEHRWPEQTARLHERVGSEEAVDLATALRNNNVPATVYYSTAEPLDTFHAQRLAACANVELRAYPDGGHDLVVLMKERGELGEILERAHHGERALLTR